MTIEPMSATPLPPSDQNLVWIDLEMTGLFPDRDRIIEIAVVVTDAQLGSRTEGPVFAIHQSDATLDAMDGNSICQDRRFLANHMPTLEAFFHYRNLDVSTLKELARRWKPDILDGFKKAQAHTALADIYESIEELVYYRQHLLAA
mgnify:CR=1 FL=1